MDSQTIKTIIELIIFSPLIGAAIAGLLGGILGKKITHSITILAVLISLCASTYLLYGYLSGHIKQSYDFTLYQWALLDKSTSFQIGFLVDQLTVYMLMVVTYVSLAVHVYTIGYMHDDPGYTRFFSYICLFTFAMLMLVAANNFVQLFFGWEAVGLVSYLLIGFWFTKESAIFANLKAFLVNRVGDFGFIIGIAAIYFCFGSLDYHNVLSLEKITTLVNKDTTIHLFAHTNVSAITFICLGLFVGAMGKSAQMPLHVWLPDSMEGPTPISALIHAATMVTAGVFMIARMSPLFEYSEVARTTVMVIGGSGAFFLGVLGIVMFDIKRVIAYSTLSQLGYMMAAMGASVYSVGMFHLMTHAAFKALLFLCSGSVIIAMHHDQDMRNMGGLRKYMPITCVTFLIGGLALSGIPPFAGFYSKDLIIEALSMSNTVGSTYAYWCTLLGATVTGLYTFRAFFLVFYTKERMSDELRSHLKESPAVVYGPLIALAIPSLVIGFIAIKYLIFAQPDFFGQSIFMLPDHQQLISEMRGEFHGALDMALHSVFTLPFWFAWFGIITMWFIYQHKPNIAEFTTSHFKGLYRLLLNKYGFDDFNQNIIAKGVRCLGQGLWKYGDKQVIDGVMVNGSARIVGYCSTLLRKIQTGYLYNYAFAMVLGLLALFIWVLWKN